MRDYNTYLDIPDIVSDILSYQPETGALTWREFPMSMFRTERGWKIANTQRSGKRAELSKVKGYYRIFIEGKLYLAHRAAIKVYYGECPSDWQIDHINGDRSDNRIENLRIVNPQDQMRNLGRARNNTSGFTGVTWDASRNKWSAKIKIDRKTVNLGRFLTLDDAVKARKEANLRFGFHENHGKIR